MAGRIDLAVGNMNELFNALLDISRLDAGALNATVSDFPVNNILKMIEATFTAAAREKGLALRVVPSSAWIRSDAILLERVLLNLVSNAIRYTPKGGIVLGCRHVGGPIAHRRLRQRRRHSQGPAAQHFRRILPDRDAGSGPARRTGPGSRHRRTPVRPAEASDRRRLHARQRLAIPRDGAGGCRTPRPRTAGRGGGNRRSVARQADRRGRRRRPGAGRHRRAAPKLGLPGYHRNVRSRGADKTRRQQAGPDHLRLSLAGRTDRHRGDRGAARRAAITDRGLPDQRRHPAGPAPRSAGERASSAAQADRADDLAHDDVPAVEGTEAGR